jgi:tetratricopeptide (TPR) repeat protein
VADYDRVVALAERAVARSDTVAALHRQAMLNTLGAALYRARRFEDAVECLNEAVALHPKGGAAADWFFLAMAHAQLGDREAASQYYDKAAAWMNETQASLDKNRRYAEELRRFRTEAAQLLRFTDSANPASDDGINKNSR